MIPGVRIDGVPMFSPTSTATLTECERKWWWQRVKGLGKDERTEAMAMGSGLAVALETLSVTAGFVEYHESRAPVDLFTDPVVYEREGWIGEETIKQAFHGYRQRYESDPDIQREVTYLLGIPGANRVLQVRVDGVTPHYLIEDKLRSGSSMRPDDLENEVRQGFQITAEIYAHWRTTGEILPLRLRCTKKIDPRKVKNRTVRKDVEAEMAEHFSKEGVFQEFIATRTIDQLVAFETELVDTANRMDELASRPWPYGRRNTKACFAFGRTCPALAACQGMASESEVMAVAA